MGYLIGGAGEGPEKKLKASAADNYSEEAQKEIQCLF